MDIYGRMDTVTALLFLGVIAVGPALGEEILFRGYVQRRWQMCWPLPAAVLLTSLFFAVFHLNIGQFVLAFPLGIWLGLIAWRCDSIWPAALGHALANGLWNLWHVGRYVWGFPTWPPWPIAVPLVVVVAGSFGAACAVLAQPLFRNPQLFVRPARPVSSP